MAYFPSLYPSGKTAEAFQGTYKVPVADPNLQMREEGAVLQNIFSALRALVWSKTKRGRPPDPPMSTWYWATLKHFLRLHWCKLVFDDCVCDSPDFSVWWCSIRGGFISTVPRKKWTWQMNGMLRRFNLEMFYQTKMEPTDCFNDEKR